jgi:mannonate dehydratase
VWKLHVSLTLRKVTDRELFLLEQLNVKYVDLSLDVFPHHQRDLPNFFQKFNFEREKENILKTIRALKERKMQVNSSNGPPVRDALFGKVDGERQVNDFCKFVKFLGENDIPIASIGLGVRGFGPADVPGRYVKEQKRGYRMGAFSLKLMKEQLEKAGIISPWSHHFRERLSFEELFSNCVKVLEEIVPVAEEYNVKLAWHPDDPPVEDSRLLPGFTSVEKINMLLEKVNNPNFGLLFCVGTRYESGEDIYKQIEYFGKKKRIFHVHFRNVRGNLLKNEGYEEVALDDGDMNMIEVLKSLKKTGYEGAINPDHVPIFSNENNVEQHGTAWALDDPKALLGFMYSVGYMRGLLSALSKI